MSNDPASSGHPVDVIIVNWNGGKELLQAARSGIAFGARVIVVDNGSSDGSLEWLVSAVPEAAVVRMGRNIGFAAACNAGVSAGTAPFIFLLNPDARIEAGALADIERAFAFHPSVTVVGPEIVGGDGQSVRSTRRFPTLATLLLSQLKMRPLARWLPPLRRYLMLDFEGRPGFVDQVIGAAFIMRRRDWDRFGGLDDGFFLLFEEVDLCRRVALAGGRSLYWPALLVRHLGSTSFRRLSHLQLQRISNRSLLRYSRRHLGLPATVVLAFTVPWALALSLVLDAARLPLQGSSRG